MDVFHWDPLEFRDPHLDVLAILVKVSGLLRRVEDKHSSSAYPRGSGPAAIVRLYIMVNKLLFEVVGSVKPMLLQVHRKVAGDYHAPSVGHESCGIHVPHQSINQWHPRATLSPPFYKIR